MIEISKEQIEKAAKVAENTYYRHPNTSSDASWRDAVTAAAPYLQSPWEPPSDEEARSALATFENSAGRVTGRVSRVDAMAQSLGWLISHRNAALLPPPVDPRRETIMEILRDWTPAGEQVTMFISGQQKMADAILAALDADVKP